MRSSLRALGGRFRPRSHDIEVCAVCGVAITDDERLLRVRGLSVHRECATYRGRVEHDRRDRHQRFMQRD